MCVGLCRRYGSDERGIAAMETLIIIPVLIWAYVGSFVFFDAFRAYNSSVKATYALADIVSRQTDTIYAYDIEGLSRLFDYMVRNTGDVRIRVSQVIYNAATDSIAIEWSHGTNGEAALLASDAETLRRNLPSMADAQRLLVVESVIPYRAVFDVGFDLITFRNFTFTKPRFAGQVPFDGSVTSPAS